MTVKSSNFGYIQSLSLNVIAETFPKKMFPPIEKFLLIAPDPSKTSLESNYALTFYIRIIENTFETKCVYTIETYDTGYDTNVFKYI